MYTKRMYESLRYFALSGVFFAFFPGETTLMLASLGRKSAAEKMQTTSKKEH